LDLFILLFIFSDKLYISFLVLSNKSVDVWVLLLKFLNNKFLEFKLKYKLFIWALVLILLSSFFIFFI
jgi:hypothetical protein